MANWNEGYVTDINYTSGFYRELSPIWLATAATLLGFRSPPLDQPYAYAELGCGQGFGTNLLATANPLGRFWGFDFNPAQIANAQRLASESGTTNIEFHEASFQQLATSADGTWPQFDFITLHGIYSWISRDNQLAVQAFIRRHLKPGGLVYISYNCSPGWSSMVPVRRLMRLHADKHPARSDIQGQEALAYIKNLREAGAGFFAANNQVLGRLERADKLDRHYLAHEYLNRDWNIHDFAEMAEDCALGKLDYLGSATLSENIDSVAVPAKLLPMLNAETDPVLRQTIMDFAINKSFRRDIYQRGLCPLTTQEHLSALRKVRLIAATALPTGPVKFKTPLGEAEGRADLYGPVLAALAQARDGMTLGEIASRPEMAGMGTDNLIEVAVLLIGAGFVHPRLETPSAEARRANRAVCLAMLDGHNYSFLAAPTLGSSVPAGFTDMVAVLLLAENPGLDEAAFVDGALRLLQAHGRHLVKNGVKLANQGAAAAELKSMHADFMAGKADLWRRLGVLS